MDLNHSDRDTVVRWARCHQALPFFGHAWWLLEAALHATLARLRQCSNELELLCTYETEAAGDFSLIGSLLPPYPRPEVLWCVRDAAYHLRWLELTDEATTPA